MGKLIKNNNGTSLVVIPKIVVDLFGWSKETEVRVSADRDSKTVLIREV